MKPALRITPETPTPTDREVIDAMTRYGGGFVVTLALLWQKADATNRARIKATWPEYWAEYARRVEFDRTNTARSI